MGSNPTPSDFQVGHSEVSKETLDTSDEENTESLCGGMVDTCDLKSHANFSHTGSSPVGGIQKIIERFMFHLVFFSFLFKIE